LRVDGVVKQSSRLAEMIWSAAECIAQLSEYEILQAGDLIMTGTPEGVGPVHPGNVLVAEISGLGRITVKVS
jgi:fumarylpyruvate hydrolase